MIWLTRPQYGREPSAARAPLPALDREVRPYFQDVLDHVRRVETRVGGLREILTSVFEAANLLEQQ